MAGTSLLTLIDDIATLMDDVAVMTKVAAKKTATVLGDDLAVNAQQLTGMTAERELPVIWAVAKGSFKNKFILVPAALLISAFIPWLIVPLLILGGLFLCFEGIEKIWHYFTHKDKEADHQALLNAVNDESVDMVVFEQKKIKGAIRTDFILSAEIIVITLGVVSASPLATQIGVLSTVALFITVGVYGLVAGIVKMDDFGLYLIQSDQGQAMASAKKAFGRALVGFAPWLMKFLSVFGTLAMFLVGGGILHHNLPLLHHLAQDLSLNTLTGIGYDMVLGILAGIVVFLLIKIFSGLQKK